MGVPYSDNELNHYWKCAFDGGEYGLGRLANQLELGCDCLGAIRYFDVPSVNDQGEPFVMKNAICMHEEDYGTLWKHYEFRTGVFEMRRSRRLVISFFCTVANYDYGFLVPLSGRYDSTRSQADRDHPDRRVGSRSTPRQWGRHGHARVLWPDPPAFFQCAFAHDGGWRAQLSDRNQFPVAPARRVIPGVTSSTV